MFLRVVKAMVGMTGIIDINMFLCTRNMMFSGFMLVMIRMSGILYTHFFSVRKGVFLWFAGEVEVVMRMSFVVNINLFPVR